MSSTDPKAQLRELFENTLTYTGSAPVWRAGRLRDFEALLARVPDERRTRPELTKGEVQKLALEVNEKCGYRNPVVTETECECVRAGYAYAQRERWDSVELSDGSVVERLDGAWLRSSSPVGGMRGEHWQAMLFESDTGADFDKLKELAARVVR